MNQQAKEITRKIEQVVNTYVSNSAFEGAVLVARSGQIVFKKAHGLSDRDRKLPITTRSSFQLASLSKPITATLVLKLIEQDKLHLNESLAFYIPDFSHGRSKKITLHHLLSHTSGIPDHFAIGGWFNADFHKSTSEQEFVQLIANLPLQFEPGVDYLYSNLGYFLLGKVVEKATGMSVAENLNKQIFMPLNMHKSGIASGFKLAPNTVKGYQWDKNGGYHEQTPKNMTLFGAGAAIFSNINDLYQFDLALYGDKLLTNESKKRLFNPQQAYGWKIGKMPIAAEYEVNVHNYDGQFDGYSSMMTRFIDDKHSIILLSNVGISYFLKQQLTFDLAAILYKQNIPERENDTALTLIKSVVSGEFKQTFDHVKSAKTGQLLDEQSLSALAFQLLWSGLTHQSLQLFSFINTEFVNSPTAKQNLLQACKHPLVKSDNSELSLCN